MECVCLKTLCIYVHIYMYIYVYIYRCTHFIHIYMNTQRLPTEQMATFTLNYESCWFYPRIAKEVFHSPEWMDCPEILFTRILLGKHHLYHPFVLLLRSGHNEMLLNIIEYYREKQLNAFPVLLYSRHTKRLWSHDMIINSKALVNLSMNLYQALL